MLNFGEFSLLKENYNQFKAIAKKHHLRDEDIDMGFGTIGGIQPNTSIYVLLRLLISPDDNYKKISLDPKFKKIYGHIWVNDEKERTMRPFLGMFAKMFFEDNCTLNIISQLVSYIMANKQNIAELMVKNNNTNEYRRLGNILDIFKIQSEFNDGRPSYEILTDAIRDKENITKIYTWINSMPSGLKNQFKENSNFNKLVNTLSVYYELGEDIQKTIWSGFFGDGTRTGKISKYKTAEEFLKDLEISIDGSYEKSTFEIIKNKILATENAVLIEADETKNCIVADIWTWKASNILGEPNTWCISYNTSDSNWYSHNYMYPGAKNKMFFIWNFNFKQNEPLSKIGVCVDSKGVIRFAHDKYDDSILSSIQSYLSKYDIYKNFLKPKISDKEQTTKENIYFVTNGAKRSDITEFDEKRMNSFINTLIEIKGITSEKLTSLLCWLLENKHVNIKIIIDYIKLLINELNPKFTKNTDEQMYGKDIVADIINHLSINNNTTDIPKQIQINPVVVQFVYWLFEKYSISTVNTDSVTQLSKYKFPKIYDFIIEEIWKAFDIRALKNQEVTALYDYLRSDYSTLSDKKKYDYMLGKIFEFYINKNNNYSYINYFFSVMYDIFNNENVIKDFCDRGYIIQVLKSDILYNKNLKYAKCTPRGFFIGAKKYFEYSDSVFESPQAELAGYDILEEFFNNNGYDIKDYLSAENLKIEERGIGVKEIIHYFKFMINNGVPYEKLNYKLDFSYNEASKDYEIGKLIEMMGEKRACLDFLNSKIFCNRKDKEENLKFFFVFTKILFKLASEGDTEIGNFLPKLIYVWGEEYGIQTGLTTFFDSYEKFTHYTDTDLNLIVNRKNLYVWDKLVDMTIEHKITLKYKILRCFFATKKYSIIEKTFDLINYKEDYKNLVDYFFKKEYEGIILDNFLEKIPFNETKIEDVITKVDNVDIINRMLNKIKRIRHYNILYRILSIDYKYSWNKNSVDNIGDNEKTYQLVTRLVRMGDKIDFEWHQYVECFKNWNYDMIKFLIDKKYLKLENKLPSTKKRIASNSLEKEDDDVRIFELLEKNGMSYNIGLLKDKFNNLSIESNKFIIKNTPIEELNYGFFTHLRKFETFEYFIREYFLKLSDFVKFNIVEKTVNQPRHYIANEDEEANLIIKKIELLLELDKDYVMEELRDNYEENKRKQLWNEKLRNYLKTLLSLKVKKISEMFDFGILKHRSA